MSATTPAQSRTTDPEEPLLLVPEAATYLRLPGSTVYRLIKTGELPALILSPRRIRLRRVDLDRWLAERTTGGVA
ncbi:helix-turn-helix transcriptional regulator [Isoptericola nanjingensis]|uniref:helix-turn-helix transcriptional regulator n=1 Tax=Isoptericola nanjingensis TaxID=903413 RepID=UPI003D199277